MSPEDHTEEELTGIHCRLDELLQNKGMTLTDLSGRVGVSVVNLSVLKNNRAKAVRFSTLVAICDVLDCEVGDLLVRDPRIPRTRQYYVH